MPQFVKSVRAALAGLFGARIPANSAAISEVGYCPRRKELVVRFRKSGRLYRYTGVPVSVNRHLWRAPSMGAYFNANVRNAFAYDELS